jgi:hypothetical protein
MSLLLLDVLRRHKWFYLSTSFYFIAAASSTSSFSSVTLGLGISAMLNIGLGSREIFYLPVSRKEIWRTRWILAIVPIILSAAVRMLMLGITMVGSHRTGDHPAWLLPSSTFLMIYIGSLFAAYIPISHYMPNLASPARRLLAKAALVLAAMTLGARILEGLPKQWNQLTGGTIVILATGMCLSVFSFFHAPRILPRRVIPLVRPGEQSGQSSGVGKRNLKAGYMRSGRAGLKLLVWSQIRAVLSVSVLCGIASQLPIVIGGWWRPDRLSMFERETVFTSPIHLAAAGSFVVAVFFAAIWILMAPDLLGLRSLRVLPVTTPTLAAMFTLIPALFWLTFWPFQLATYWILAGHLPSTFRLALLAGLTGLTCLATSAALQSWVKGPAQFVLLPLLSSAGFGALHFHGKPLGSTVTAVIGILGLAGVAVSFVLNDRALQLNGSAYISKLRLPGIGRQRWIVQ